MRTIRKIMFAAGIAASLASASAPAMALTGNGGCDPDVAQAQKQARDAYITGQTALAEQNFSRRTSSFSNMSCLERLMNSGMDIFFQPPGMTDLLGLLENFVCDKANGLFQQATAPLNQVFNSTNLPVNEIIPGVNIGSIGGGINIRVNNNSQGEGIVNTNVDDVLGKIESNTDVSGNDIGRLFR